MVSGSSHSELQFYLIEEGKDQLQEQFTRKTATNPARAFGEIIASRQRVKSGIEDQHNSTCLRGTWRGQS